MGSFGTQPKGVRCSFERRRRSVSFIEVAEAANIAPVVVTVRCLGSAEFEKLSSGSLRLSSPKNARGQSSPELNSQNERLWNGCLLAQADVGRIGDVGLRAWHDGIISYRTGWARASNQARPYRADRELSKRLCSPPADAGSLARSPTGLLRAAGVPRPRDSGANRHRGSQERQ
ncbi:MAG: hypothetical protein JWP84_4353 [Tardiphaga sp.]|nr:hypothetical protein [Tardiphaga sp.]